MTDGEAVVDVGVLVARSPGTAPADLRRFARRAVEDTVDELERATDVTWTFHDEEPAHLDGTGPYYPSDFLDEASLRMVEGPYDAVLVVTDATLVTRRREAVPGLASPVGQVAVVSTRRLRTSPRGESVRSLDSPAVRWNAAALVLHLVGHLLGADHADGDRVMAPFRFDPDRREHPRFDESVRDRLARRASRLSERVEVASGPLNRFGFHVASAARHPRQVLFPLLRNRALLLPLSLPALATAAIAPTLVVVFSAEAWDVGVHMSDLRAAAFALATVLASAVYLTFGQRLFFPRQERHVLTEQTAVVNVTLFLTILSAFVGLLAMVTALMLAVELFVFPQNLVDSWPTLVTRDAVGFVDLLRTAVFVATLGVGTGALAGGLENRTVLRHVALFLRRP